MSIMFKSMPMEAKANATGNIVFKISTNIPDRDSDILEPLGAKLENYRNNPVVLFAHDYSSLPVGKSLWEKVYPEYIESEVEFAPTAFAQDCKKLCEGGFLNAASVGFVGLDYEPIPESKWGKRYKSWELLEWSVVPVPSNFGSLIQNAKAKGLNLDAFEKELKDLEQKNEELKEVDILVDSNTKEVFVYEDGQKTAKVKIADEYIEKLFELSETKKPDLEGNPSVWDIMDAIRMTINPTGMYQMHGPWVEDVYPIRYPSGSVIIEKEEKYYLYQYEYVDGKATLSTDYTELQEVYQPKSFNFKSGASLSSKNKKMLDEIHKQLAGCGDTLRKFIDSAGTMEDEPPEGMPPDEPMMTATRTAPAGEEKTLADYIISQHQALEEIKTQVLFLSQKLSETDQKKEASEDEINLDAIEFVPTEKNAASDELEIEPGELKELIGNLLDERLKNFEGGK